MHVPLLYFASCRRDGTTLCISSMRLVKMGLVLLVRIGHERIRQNLQDGGMYDIIKYPLLSEKASLATFSKRIA